VTLGRVIETGKPQAILCQGIQVGRLDLTSITTNVGKPQVVGHDQDDIGPLGRGGLRNEEKGYKK
jgi:hypothetical protein